MRVDHHSAFAFMCAHCSKRYPLIEVQRGRLFCADCYDNLYLAQLRDDGEWVIMQSPIGPLDAIEYTLALWGDRYLDQLPLARKEH